MITINRAVVYLGFNDPRKHVRGTENVIKFQGAATTGRTFFVFRGDRAEVFRWGCFVAIAIPKNYFIAFFYLRHIIARIRIRHGCPIIHGHSYLLTAIVSGAPVIFTIHDALGYNKRKTSSRWVGLFKVVECWVYQRAKIIHSISRFTWSEAVAQHLYSSKMVIIFNTTKVVDGCVKESSSDSPSIPYILVVRSIEPRANLDIILDLAAQMLLIQPGTVIKIAGKGPLLNHYKHLASIRGLSNVELLGYVSDQELNKLYCGTVCVVMPALYGEGFGLPLIEAYARGIPAIGSNVCAVPEIIAQRELLFENNVESLLAALSAARLLPREKFVEHYRRHFEESLILDQYRRLYASLGGCVKYPDLMVEEP